jgi:site-specific DNA recombinase
MVSALECILAVRVLADRLLVTLRSDPDNRNTEHPRITVPFRISTRTGRSEIIQGDKTGATRDPVLIRALRQAHARLHKDPSGGPTLDAAPDMIRARRILRLAFLSPHLQRAILEGRQPRGLTLARLIDSDIPLLWSEQRRPFETNSLD